MTKTRHSYVPFYTDAWLAGTARMPRMVKSVYFDICCYTWDTARKVPDAEIILMLADTGGQGDQIVDALVKSGKLQRDEDGNVWSERALAEAEKALDLWKKKSQGGKGRAASARAKAAELQESLQEGSGEKEKEKDSLSGEGKTSSSLLPASGNEAEPEKPEAEKPDDGEKPKRISAGQCAEVFAAWNAVAKPLGLKGADKMTDKRQAAIRARIEENGADAVQRALAALPECEFVLSEARKGANWTSIDWFLRPNTITKINEGQYRTANGKGSSAWAEMDQ